MFKGALYYKLENMTVGLSPSLRKWGQSLFRQGMASQGSLAHEDYMVPSLRCVAVSASKFPRLLDVSICSGSDSPKTISLQCAGRLGGT